ncbi:MAG: hypothetical protein ACJ73D_07285 [Pyrinomonadaceae bacterium]
MAPKIGFTDVKKILDDGLTAWEVANGQADLTSHGASFSWATKPVLLAAEGHGKRLIQPEVIGNGKASAANLVIDLRKGFPATGRMPLGGPFIADADVQRIEDWINAGCPD